MRVRSLLLLLAAALAVVASATPALAAAAETPPTTDPVRVTPRIVGGTTVPAGELAYVAFVLIDDGHGGANQCGGTVIDPSWILTAAHCTIDLETGAGRPASAFEVRTGSRFASSGGIVHAVDAVRRQPMDPALLDKDAALLHLVNPALVTPVTMIGSTPDELALDDPGVLATTAGWGLTSEDGDSGEEQLRKVSIPIKPDGACTTAYPDDESSELYPTYYLPANMLCAGAPGKDSCFGDSGGPLVAPGTRRLGHPSDRHRLVGPRVRSPGLPRRVHAAGDVRPVGAHEGRLRALRRRDRRSSTAATGTSPTPCRPRRSARRGRRTSPRSRPSPSCRRWRRARHGTSRVAS